MPSILRETLVDDAATAARLKAQIDEMSHKELAYYWRFAASGSPLVSGEVGDYFKEVFAKKGGMTTAISKEIGWVQPK